MKILPIYFSSWLFKDFIHLSYEGNNKLMESISYVLKKLPDSAFLPPTPTPAVELDFSDMSQFPPLSTKRQAQDTMANSKVKCPKMSHQKPEDREQTSHVETDPPLPSGHIGDEKTNSKYEYELTKLKEELAEAKKAIDDLKCAKSTDDQLSKSDVEELKTAVLALQASKGNDFEMVDNYKNQMMRIDQGCLAVLDSFKQRLEKVEKDLNNTSCDKDNADSEEIIEEGTSEKCDLSSYNCTVQ